MFLVVNTRYFRDILASTFQPLGKHLHFLDRLFVAFFLGHADAVFVGVDSRAFATGLSERDR